MNKYRLMLFLSVLIGFTIGFSSFILLEEEDNQKNNFCKEVESGIEIEGNAKCYSSQRSTVNFPDGIRNRTDLKCACKIVQGGRLRWVPVAAPSNQ